MASQDAITMLTHPASQANMTHPRCNHLKERNQTPSDGTILWNEAPLKALFTLTPLI